MRLADALERGHALAAWVVARRARTALATAAATFVVLAALAGGPGISRDEAAVLERSDAALRAPGGVPVEAPPLAAEAAAATRAIASPLGLSHLRAARLGTALLGALLSAALALLAWDLAGPAAALLAPALFWSAPRHLHAGLVLTPDLALAALAVATALTWRRAAVDPDARRRVRAAVRAGLLFGAALAARADAWVLLVALALHAALARVFRAAPVPGALEARLRGAPLGLVSTLLLGPLVLLAAWPSLVISPLARAAALAGPGATASALSITLPGIPGPLRHLAAAALTIPAGVLAACAAGVGHAVLRLVRALRGRAPAGQAADEVLLLACVLAPFAAAAAGIAPASGGVRPVLHAMPFLALLGARALLAASRVAWPARAAPLAASLALVVLWPAVRATAHFHPSGASAWNELAGGAPGAATLRLPRQDGGEAVARVLDAVNARARDGARVWWPSVAPAALRAFARDGRLRADLAIATGPDDADLAVVALDGAGRDAEYRAWGAFRTARPVAGAYLDEVPLALVYARLGAWR